MFEQLTQYSNLGFFILRLAIAIVFIYHALPKLKSPKGMAQGLGWQPAMVVALGLVEFLSSIALVIGIRIQLASLLLSIVMIGAIWHKIKKWHVPFYSKTAMGWEFDFILLAANIFILLNGPMR